MADPLGFTPRELCGWGHRFDDPQREYRTLYCAELRITCFRETLAGFRPSLHAVRAHRDLFGGDPPHAAKVPAAWLEQQAVARGRIEIPRGRLHDVDEPGLRSEFEREHPKILEAHGMDHLDISEVRGRHRAVTQALSRWLFDRGAAGIVYRSNLDDLPCVALFEGRAFLTPEGGSEHLANLPRELIQVCEELGLRLGTTP